MGSFKKQLRAVLFAGIGATAMMTSGPAMAGSSLLDGLFDHVKESVTGQAKQGTDNVWDKASCKLQGGVMVQGRYDSRNTRSGSGARSSGSNANKCLFPGTKEYAHYEAQMRKLEASARALELRQEAAELRLEQQRIKNDRARAENDILRGTGQHAGSNNTSNININQGQQQNTGGFGITSSRDGGAATNSVMTASEIATLNIAACESTRARDCEAEHRGIGNQVSKVGNLQLTAKYNQASIVYRQKVSRNNSAKNEQNQTRSLISKLNK